MTNEQLQELAAELASLNRETDVERVRAIEWAIVDYELGLLKERGGKAYFPLLRKHNVAIPYEAFYDILIDILIPLLKKYDPAKNATFTTALKFYLDKRVADYWKKLDKEKSDDDGDEQTVDITDIIAAQDYAEEQSRVRQSETAADAFAAIADAVVMQRELEEHRSKTKRTFIGAFFTHDVTKDIKEDENTAEAAVSKNTQLFPAMEINLLKFLMLGAFAGMRDVADNPLNTGIKLSQRLDNIAACYGVSRQTLGSVGHKEERYNEWLNSVYKKATA
jgi:hypothetical protein